MNERIEKILEQVGGYGTKALMHPDDVEKFAELIVKECASINFRRELGLSGDQNYEVSQLIKKHFGVD